MLQHQMPAWASYGVHALALGLAAACSYYVVLFSGRVDDCAACAPKATAGACGACPASLRGRDPQAVALDWLVTLGAACLANLLVLEPISVGLQVPKLP